jgi:hypothetical protein
MPTQRSQWPRRFSAVKNRALPHIGPDAVKIGGPDAGGTWNFVVRGTIRARYTRETGE